MLKFIFVLFLLGGCSGHAAAQKLIRGTVMDAATGETLPSASISIENTYRGTITNRDGKFSLTIPDSLLPATLNIRFLGYETKKVTITRNTPERLDVPLKPDVFEMDELVVTDEDPALRIMREVIRRKQVWREQLDTYQAEAYTRQTLSSDTSIVMISETASTAYWARNRGHREVIHSQRKTANINEGQNFSGVSYIPNFYDDNIEIAGFTLPGVTHPDALKFYNFKLDSRTSIDEQQVFVIHVTPARTLQPLFEGTIHVLDKAYALLVVRLKPNDVVDFPPPVQEFDTAYEQQFHNFGQDYWLPVDVRIEGNVKISMVGLEFPMIRFRQVARITDYQVNVELPDSLYRQQDLFSVDSTAIGSDSLFTRNVDAVPLSDNEVEAYATLDSTDTLEKAFKPEGFFARYIEMDSSSDREDSTGGLNIPGTLSPAARFNRVDELYLGGRYKLPSIGQLEAEISGGYSTGYSTWGYGGGVAYTFNPQRKFSQKLNVRYLSNTTPRFSTEIYQPFMTMIPNLLGYQNYFDYYRAEGIELSALLNQNRRNLSLELGFRSQKHTSLDVNTAYDLLGKDRTVRVNPPVEEGRLHSLFAEAGYNLDNDYNFGVTGMRRIKAGIEYSDDSLGSDFGFVRYYTRIDWNFPTFYQRRFLPNMLDLSLTAGTRSGDLPLQRMGTVDGTIGPLSPFGTLKTMRNAPYEGEQYLALNVEHNFRTIPFEILGLKKLVDLNWSVIAFGGAARTWIPKNRMQELQDDYGYTPRGTGPVHYEAGLSLNGILGLFRVDFAQRLDQPGFMIGVSVARFF